MKMVKKIIPLIIVLLMVLSGCGSGAGGNAGNAADNTAEPAGNEASDGGNESAQQPSAAAGSIKVLSASGNVISDQDSADIKSEDGNLSLAIGSGAVYFGGGRALEDGKSLKIAAPNATIDVKDAIGYAAVIGEKKTAVIIACGTASIVSSDGAEQDVKAGQCVLASEKDGKAVFAVREIGPEDYPQALLEALCVDPAALETVAAQNSDAFVQTLKAVLAYRDIMEHPEEYDYALNGAKATGVYDFAVVKMQKEDTVPSLLLKQEAVVEMQYGPRGDTAEHIRIFRYNTETGETDVIEEVPGGEYKDIYLMKVSMANDGDGMLMEIRHKDKPREVSVYRISVADDPKDGLKSDLAAKGTDSAADAPESRTIQWKIVSKEFPAGDIESFALPEDGDRTVLTGYIDTFSYEAAVELQGMPDWNGTNPSTTYRLIVLDQPAYLDGWQLEHVEDRRVRMIRVSGITGSADIPDNLDGHRIIFSVDDLSWSNGTDIPVGEPYTTDVNVLEVLD